MQISRGARKHGISEEEIRGVLAAPLRTVVQGERTLLIGLGPNRDLLEIVVDGGTEKRTVVHAMRLRPKHYHHLQAP
ncbi:hypothetical protein [Pseudonocardia acidicola]|uniref:Toxin n=1 Tax=Pseudonocardia acidicola TaxID=2724939 RepID=A0ABX1SFH7_9PSEU|nr:hypothetical protein [Pseudonocardia acidicola]NMH99136.1 hypothetical protein [Pseudonocardia acidicola]